jgi:transcriptional regulator with XRE-family HTH domain
VSPAEYKAQRQLRGTQESVAAQLGVHPQTIAKRERGTADAPITREAWLALLSLPKKRRAAKPQNTIVSNSAGS